MHSWASARLVLLFRDGRSDAPRANPLPPNLILTSPRDETAVNGAQIYYTRALNIDAHSGLIGLVNSAPYLCCAFSCWLNYPLNRLLDRRGVIFVTCLISSLTCLGQAFPQTWQVRLDTIESASVVDTGRLDGLKVSYGY